MKHRNTKPGTGGVVGSALDQGGHRAMDENEWMAAAVGKPGCTAPS